MTDELWMKFYKKDFGEKNFNLVIERMKKKKVAFRWKQLYEVIFSYMIFFLSFLDMPILSWSADLNRDDLLLGENQGCV